ncbi:uncharacterized protein knl1 [Centropristis striata]|uniref:uncharacterized protein knl1 n=1 Tax=Centropristis striata TaxID=184440 RepID=UPI0027DEEA52|nr:uncharacterized protein knl1 [Centropristis striata]
MEPLDPAKNDKGSGFSKRRISSILKAPRKSVSFPEPQQQENVVECVKPVDKRNSRRVSFAPANDVLLFSKDAKNASPTQSHSQEIITTAAASQNRVQVDVPEDGIQPIMGMETLLNAPLHASQQRDMVNFDMQQDLGEKTVMFSDDAFMDMTQSQTINIASDAELFADISLHNHDTLSTRGEKSVMFTANDGSMDTTLCHTANTTSRSVSLPASRNVDFSGEKINISSSVASLDPGFSDFLASLSKASVPSVNPGVTRMRPPAGASSEASNGSLPQVKTHKADVDKENKAPPSIFAVMEKPLNASRKTGDQSFGSALWPEDDVNMGDDDDDDDPFQGFFSSKEMYSKRVSKTAEKTKQQISKTPTSSSNPKDMTSLKNPPLHDSSQRHKVNLDKRDERQDKTVMFTADEDFMDMTQSHTANIASGSLAPPNQNLSGFLSSLSKPGASSGKPALPKMAPSTAASSKDTVNANSSLPQLKSIVGKENQSTRSSGESFNGGTICSENDVSMDMTEAQTGRILGIAGSDDAFQFLFPTQDTYSHGESLKKVETTSGQKSSKKRLSSVNCAGMETSFRQSLKTKVQRNPAKFDTEDNCGERTVRFSANDACMDVTQSHTVNIATDLGFLPTCGEKTVRFNANDAAMDMTQCLTVNIDSNLVSDSVLPVMKQAGACGLPQNRSSSARSLDPKSNTSLSKPSGTMPTAEQFSNIDDSLSGVTICPEDDISMDMTEAQTGRILGTTDTDNPLQCLFPTQDKYPNSLKTAVMTSQQQHNEARRSTNNKGMETSLTASLKMKMHQVKFDAEADYRDKTVRFTADDACMDVTKSHTVNIATDLQLQSHRNADFLPACGEKTMRFTANDAAMDVTKSHTVNIATDVQLQLHQNVDFLPSGGEKTVRFTAVDACMDATRSHTVNIATGFHNEDFLPTYGEKTMRFTANDAAMDVTKSHTVNIATDLQLQSCQNVGFIPASGEKTMRFTATDAAMDVTKSHTVNIATDFEPRSHQNLDFLPACRERTKRFTANDAAMDVTKSHTVNIATDLQLQSHQNVDFLPACGEKTLRFTATDATMDVTKSHTVNIATDFEPRSHQNVDFLPACGEKTKRFTANDAAMDVTKSHTVNIATDFEPRSHQNVDYVQACGENTKRFTATDATMDVTKCLTVNIASNSVPDSLLPYQDADSLSSHENVDLPLSAKKTHRPQRNQSSSALTLDPSFKNSLSRPSGSGLNPVITEVVAPAAWSSEETEGIIDFLHQPETQRPDVDTEKEAPGFISAFVEKPVNKSMTVGPENNVNNGMTEAQTGCILRRAYTDEPLQYPSSTLDLYPNSDHMKKTEVTLQERIEAQGSPISDGVGNLPDSLDSNEPDTKKEREPINQICTSSQKIESPPSVVGHEVDAAPSRKSRQMILADLQTKLRRLSHVINAAPDTTAMDSCTASLPHLEQDADKNSDDKTKSLPVTEPDLEMGLPNTQENTQDECPVQEEQQPSTSTTPFKLKTQQLLSRLSMGNFQAKLPQRSKPDDPKKVNSVGDHTRTVTANFTNHLSDYEEDMSNIYDEELGSCEDMSETLDMMSPQKATERVTASYKFNIDEELLQDDVFEQDFISAVHGTKRPLPEDEVYEEEEKRMKTSNEVAADAETSHFVEGDGNTPTAPGMTTKDYFNSSHTAGSRCEATFESTLKQSLMESQLEGYASDIQRKFDDGTVTVLEFFKIFNIDFVIHNPRQSVLPGRFLSDEDRTPLDLLKDRHINRPKQLVYEADVLNLTEKVEGLKVRMRDLDRPLKTVNRPLWEEVINCSEQEIKCFGAKLKERNNLFRKMSKVQSHEMKEVLYSNLVQANLEEQQKLRGKLEEADAMLKSLDDCICELETELAAVEEKGSEDKPSLKSLQEEMQKVTEALADNDRQISELEMQKQQNSNKLNRLKAETRNLESHVTALHMLSEWKFGEKGDNFTVFTFLHETLHLQLVYEKSNGNDADNQSERKISDITFKIQLDADKSQGHACLVHKLLSQYIEGETDWVEKYPTSRHVPALLHDVSLVVSRCRLLGEELRLLKMWGGLRLNVLNISCVDTRVHIIFSSLKTVSKFEVIFSVSLINHLYALQVQSFKNTIGNTAIQQIEEIVASFSPAKNLLTKIVKKIHENLLR